jgi:hypothetical protein
MLVSVSASHGNLSSAPSRNLQNVTPDPLCYSGHIQLEAPAAMLLCLWLVGSLGLLTPPPPKTLLHLCWQACLALISMISTEPINSLHASLISHELILPSCSYIHSYCFLELWFSLLANFCFSSFADFSTIKMEVTYSSEMLIITRLTQHHIPEDCLLQVYTSFIKFLSYHHHEWKM